MAGSWDHPAAVGAADILLELLMISGDSHRHLKHTYEAHLGKQVLLDASFGCLLGSLLELSVEARSRCQGSHLVLHSHLHMAAVRQRSLHIGPGPGSGRRHHDRLRRIHLSSISLCATSAT